MVSYPTGISPLPSTKTAGPVASRSLSAVAIVHDYLTQRGGAERVVLSMLKAFPDAPLYTSLYEPEATYPEFANYDVRPMWTNRLRPLRLDHRRGLPMYPLAFSSLRIPDAQMVLCSSSGFAHGVRTTARKVVYCYTPARWLYEEAGAYMAGWPASVRAANRCVRRPLRAWDRHAASSADAYLTSSSVVRDRIRATYGVDAEVLPPAVSTSVGSGQPIQRLVPGYVLCASRLLRYKNVDAVVSAFDLLDDARLVVVGDGPERRRLHALAGNNVTFLGRVTDAELRWLYMNCAGLVSAAYEDFGLTPVEAAAIGKPAAVLRAGGFLDTVVDGQTGLFFDALRPESIALAVTCLLNRTWDSRLIRAHAERFGEDRFAESLRRVVFAESTDGR